MTIWGNAMASQGGATQKKKKRPDKSDQKKVPRRSLQERAEAQVNLSFDPMFDEIRQQRVEAKDTLGEDRKRLESIFGAYGQNVANMLPGIQSATSSLLGQVGQQSQGLSQYFSSPEAQNLLGAMGQGQVAQLGAAGLANINSLRGAGQQAASQGLLSQKELLQDYNDLIKSLQETKLDAKRDMREQILERLDALRDQRRQTRLANEELKLRQELANKQLGFEKKKYADTRSDRDHAQDVVDRQLSEEEQREQLRQDIKRLTRRSEGMEGSLDELRAEYPTFGWVDDQPGYYALNGDFVELPRFEEMYRKRRKINKRIKKKKRQRRNL